MSTRVGFGFDVHRLVAGRPLIIGGVPIPFAKGLLGHSDADVALHAVASALLGAVGAGDLGTHFPDTDPRWKGASSRRLLAEVVRLVRRSGGRVGNADVTVLAQRPRLEPYKARIRAGLARQLGVPAACVNVKASTYEGIGPIGHGRALAAYAVATVTIGARRRRRQS
ncbi:MAG: 2-C-methyl-D-erythritol 2,4-cyclodiphosphate synthase [Candidatus Omnitrophica bacterium]|nr:2-C-methyl-D-erythritol 2,4-cyclodiphosphate synthase [Candidatus Omnitrophota bacterium]